MRDLQMQVLIATYVLTYSDVLVGVRAYLGLPEAALEVGTLPRSASVTQDLCSSPTPRLGAARHTGQQPRARPWMAGGVALSP